MGKNESPNNNKRHNTEDHVIENVSRHKPELVVKVNAMESPIEKSRSPLKEASPVK